jgi:hypothetical protein
MTLHLIRTGLWYTVHASDRKLTMSDGSAFDENANKSILLWARDAWVSIGFAGIAYLDSTPTDQWIVERITGQKYPKMDHAPAKFSYVSTDTMQPPGRWESIGLVVRRLLSELEAWQRRASQPDRLQALQIVIAGSTLRWRNKSRVKAAPMLLSIRKRQGESTFTIVREPRRRYSQAQSLLEYVPAQVISQSEIAEIKASLAQPVASHKESAVRTQRVFIDAIRNVAKRDARVGSAVLSVLMPPIAYPTIVTYSAAPASLPSLGNEETKMTVPSFSPWFVGRLAVFPPSEMRGTGWEMSQGPIRVVTECAEARVSRLSDLLLVNQSRAQWRSGGISARSVE